MLSKLADWLQNHKLSSHAIAAGLIGFFGLYTTDPQLAQFVNGLLSHYPKVAHALATASGIYLLYRQSQKEKP